MAHLLEYRYQLGDLLVYTQTTYMLLDDPELPGETKQVGGSYALSYDQEIVAKSHLPQGGGGGGGSEVEAWVIELRQKLLSSQGALCEGMTAEALERSSRIRMDKTGVVYDVNGENANRAAAFPTEPVEVGQVWTIPEGITFQVDSFTDVEDDVVAQVSSLADSQNPDGSSTRVQQLLRFSVRKGHQLSSRSLVVVSWPTGRKLQTVVELDLQARKAAARGRSRNRG